MDQGVGHEVKRLREQRGWSQAKLAVEADMSVSGISMIENGQRNLTTTTLAKLASAFGLEIADLFPKAQAPLLLEPEPADPELTEAERIEELRGFAILLNKFIKRWTEETQECLAAGRVPFEHWALEKDSAAMSLVQIVRETPSIGQRAEIELDLSQEEQQAKLELSKAVNELFRVTNQAYEVERSLETNGEEVPASMVATRKRHLAALRDTA